MASGADQFVDLLMALREENHGRKPSANQLAKALGISAHDAKEILDDMDPAPQNKKLRVSKEPDHHPLEPPAPAPSCPPDLEDTFRDEDVEVVEAVEPLSQSTRWEEIPAAQLDPPLEMPPAGDLKAPVERLGSQRLGPQVCVCVCVESLREREREKHRERERGRERERYLY